MAGLSLGMKCLKCSVFVFNIICLLCALLLIGVGAYVQVKFSAYGPELQKVWQAAPIAILVLGGIILLVSFLGCCGAIRENVCMLYMYGALLALLLIGEVVVAVLAIVYKDTIDAKVKEVLTQYVQDYDTSEEIAKSIDMIQENFECCGAVGPGDYGTRELPKSCKSSLVPYTKGCTEAFGQFLKSNLIIVACAAFGVCFIQLLSTIIAFCLGKHISDYEGV
ncbi:23 kDa integral membrane protein [Fasciolopsis buskii]|uniref:Tetraspanin n=1 Tax=Fasciolopsis buskii TaxID=27845 RepID=A0A8E0RN00_9TREM|nr:23 kDa integral membrane protein [Fasciolopsis buski]